MQRFSDKTELELKIRNYSSKTVKSYLRCLREYFNFKKENLTQLDVDNIKRLSYIIKRPFFTQTKNGTLSL